MISEPAWQVVDLPEHVEPTCRHGKLLRLIVPIPVEQRLAAVADPEANHGTVVRFELPLRPRSQRRQRQRAWLEACLAAV